jgi:glycosyltransferase involved in cell wall biosynthesis
LAKFRIAIACFDFTERNFRRQPWKYVYELAQQLVDENNEVFVLTNGARGEYEVETWNLIHIVRFRVFRRFFRYSKPVENVISRNNFHIVLWVAGPLSFLRGSPPNSKILQSLQILTFPLYFPSEILRVGLREILLNFVEVCSHFICSIMPSRLFRRMSRKNSFVVLSKRNMNRLMTKGVKKRRIVLLRPAFRFDLIKEPESSLKKNSKSQNIKTILFMGSPATIRGPDLLLRSFEMLSEITCELRLIFLSRLERTELRKEDNVLRKSIRKSPKRSLIRIDSGLHDPGFVEKEMQNADIICLPFRLVPSDVPISVLEALNLEKMVVASDLDGISELLHRRGIVFKSGDINELTKALLTAITTILEKDRSHIDAIRLLKRNYPQVIDTKLLLRSGAENSIDGTD